MSYDDYSIALHYILCKILVSFCYVGYNPASLDTIMICPSGDKTCFEFQITTGHNGGFSPRSFIHPNKYLVLVFSYGLHLLTLFISLVFHCGSTLSGLHLGSTWSSSKCISCSISTFFSTLEYY